MIFSRFRKSSPSVLGVKTGNLAAFDRDGGLVDSGISTTTTRTLYAHHVLLYKIDGATAASFVNCQVLCYSSEEITTLAELLSHGELTLAGKVSSDMIPLYTHGGAFYGIRLAGVAPVTFDVSDYTIIDYVSEVG